MSSSTDLETPTGQSNDMLYLPGQFGRWWLGELADLMPARLKSRSATTASCLILELQGVETILIESAARAGERELGRIAGEKVDGVPDKAALTTSELAGLKDRRYRGWPLVVRLGSGLGLRKVVDLPMAVIDEDLDQLLQFELDRLTPFKAEDVGFAWHVLGKDEQAGQVKIQLDMAPKGIIDKATSISDHFGRPVDRIELTRDGSNRHPLNLLPRSADSGAERGWFFRAVQMAAIGLLITALVIPMARQRAMLGGLESELNTAREQAEQSLALREQIETLEQDARFLDNVRDRQPAMITVLAELTRLFPDDSYLTQLHFDGTSMEFTGLATKASDLITVLSRSPMLTSPSFQSAVVFDSQAGKERFLISADLADGVF